MAPAAYWLLKMGLQAYAAIRAYFLITINQEATNRALRGGRASAPRSRQCRSNFMEVNVQVSSAQPGDENTAFRAYTNRWLSLTAKFPRRKPSPWEE
jgi:hypothetical protein